MNITMRGAGFDVTPAIETYVSKKFSSLEKFLDASADALCEVEVGKTTRHHKSGDIFKAEVHITRPGEKDIYAVAEKEDIYAAIDVVRDELERIIVSSKKKRDTLFRRGALRLKSLLKRNS